MGPVSGYVLTAHGFPTIYIMSDCKWEDCIRQAIEQFSPDYIIVNSGGAIFPEFSTQSGFQAAAFPVFSADTAAPAHIPPYILL